ncbi:MAG: hypothetical protein ACRCR9_06405 [Chitinophagaceae bacterium]
MAKYFCMFLVIICLFSCDVENQAKSPEVSSIATIIQDTLSTVQGITSEPDTTNNWKIGKYFCPMHCEGERMYLQAGECPKCEMDLRIWQATGN